MRISCTPRLFLLLASTTSTVVKEFSVVLGIGILPSASYLSTPISVSAPLTTMMMITSATRRMVSKDCINDKNDDK